MEEQTKTVRSAVEFSTSEFVFAHGRAPRGEGYWAFDFGKGPEFAPGTRSYGDAKKWARGVAQDRGVSRVTVCS